MKTMAGRIVAIHQPNFFPWLGYFQKIAQADVFVFMDDVAYPKSGNSMGSWTNRVKLLIQQQPTWVGCRVVREHGIQKIKDTLLDDKQPWREKIIKTIEYSYKKAPCFHEVMPWLRQMILRQEDNLAAYNIANIEEVTARLGLKAMFARQSDLKTTQKATDLLIEITQAVGGTAYLCGGGASGYQEDDKFEPAQIELIYQNFQHPVYFQQGNLSFFPGMSIIDALMNRGFEQTRSLLMGTRQAT